ncbi:MAG: transcriptional repressor [Clostridia bacterium]|nr:transcriptional repressor [Clostridia bacterium]
MNARISAQAKQVLSVLADKRCHMTAEEILASLESIGTATVYRALDHLTELGMIRRLSLGKKSAVYEYIRDSHMHFVCNCCGKVYDIQTDFSGMSREAAKMLGHHVNWTEVTAHGVCSICQQSEADETEASGE